MEKPQLFEANTALCVAQPEIGALIAAGPGGWAAVWALCNAAAFAAY